MSALRMEEDHTAVFHFRHFGNFGPGFERLVRALGRWLKTLMKGGPPFIPGKSAGTLCHANPGGNTGRNGDRPHCRRLFEPIENLILKRRGILQPGVFEVFPSKGPRALVNLLDAFARLEILHASSCELDSCFHRPFYAIRRNFTNALHSLPGFFANQGTGRRMRQHEACRPAGA